MFFLDKEPPGVWKPRRKYMLTVLRQHGLGETQLSFMCLLMKIITLPTFSTVKLTNSFTAMGQYSEWAYGCPSFNRWASE